LHDYKIRQILPDKYGAIRELDRGDCVCELILLMFGYRLVEWFINAGSGSNLQEGNDEKTLHLETLQKIYEIKESHCGRTWRNENND
jgi:hypothetical protein